MLTWLLHHFRYGAIDRNKVFAYSRSLARLSSQKMITLPGNEAYSEATAATGRVRTLRWYITATAQKSQPYGQPRVANNLPPVRSRRWYNSLRAIGAVFNAGGMVEQYRRVYLPISKSFKN